MVIMLYRLIALQDHKRAYDNDKDLIQGMGAYCPHISEEVLSQTNKDIATYSQSNETGRLSLLWFTLYWCNTNF